MYKKTFKPKYRHSSHGRLGLVKLNLFPQLNTLTVFFGTFFVHWFCTSIFVYCRIIFASNHFNGENVFRNLNKKFWSYSLNAKNFITKKIHLIRKMRPLVTSHRIMVYLSMCSPDELPTSRQKWIHIACTTAVLFLNVFCCVGSFVYFLKYISIAFDGAMLALMVAIGEFGLIYFMIAAILMRQQIKKIFTNTSTIYKCSK